MSGEQGEVGADGPHPHQHSQGFFITFEGPEGAGKSTQIALLAARLTAEGWPHTLTREPGGTEIGDQLRALVLDTKSRMNAMTEFLIYSASRAQLVGEVMRPALERGEVLVCDRYVDSSYAYQGDGRGLELAGLRAVSEAATGGLLPDLTVLLDLAPEVGLGRAARVGELDRIEQAGPDFHQRVRQGFLTLAAAEPGRFLVLDATRPRDELAERVWQRLCALRGRE